MTMRYRHAPLKVIREIPPRIRIVQPEHRYEHPVDRYLNAVDQEIQQSAPDHPYAGLGNIAATVFREPARPA
jgi:hypothetical protein